MNLKKKNNAVEKFPVQTNLKGVQRFLGMGEWYHKFVPNFSELAETLNALKRRGANLSGHLSASLHLTPQRLIWSPLPFWGIQILTSLLWCTQMLVM